MIPNFFTKLPIPKRLPKEMSLIANKLKKTKSKKACLEKAYFELGKNFIGCIGYTYSQFGLVFQRDINKIWKRKGCLHCTHHNFLLRVLLIKSGKFSEEEIKQKLTLIWFSPHQYLQVKINSKWIDVDLWGKVHGIKFGKHAGGSIKL